MGNFIAFSVVILRVTTIIFMLLRVNLKRALSTVPGKCTLSYAMLHHRQSLLAA